MNTKKSIYFFLSFVLIIFTTVFWQFYLNEKRDIFWEPDDHFHYIIKASNIKHCGNEKCYYENLFSEDLQNLNEDQTYEIDSQIHRIVFSYHPLYTFFIEKFSNIDTIFDDFKLYHLLLSFVQGLIIFIYLKRNISPFQFFLCALILSLYCFNNNWGISHATGWSLVAVIGMYGVNLQFQNKYFGILIIFIASLFHKIGLVLLLIGFLTYVIFTLYSNFKCIPKNKKNYEILFFNSILFFILFFISYKIRYSVFDLSNLNELNLYKFDISFYSVVDLIKTNIENLFSASKRLFYLNPILIFFFISSFFIDLGEKILIIKIFTLILLMFTVIFFIPTGGSTFAIGHRTWHLFVINYLILSICSLFFLSKKFLLISYVKKLFLIMIPIFGFYGTLLNHSYVEYFSLRHDNYYDSNNIRNYQKKIDSTKKIYFDTTEKTFYYYLISGFIKNNFFFTKSHPNFKKNYIPEYYVIDNPLKTIYGADIFLYENLKLNIEGNNNNSFHLKFFSKNNKTILINKKKYYIKSGYNFFQFENNQLQFNNISSPVKITGLKVKKNQNLEWPWNENINLKLEYKIKEILDRNTILRKFYFSRDFKTYVYNFNFSNLVNKINSKFESCKNIIQSDVDTTMIIKLEC